MFNVRHIELAKSQSHLERSQAKPIYSTLLRIQSFTQKSNWFTKHTFKLVCYQSKARSELPNRFGD